MTTSPEQANQPVSVRGNAVDRRVRQDNPYVIAVTGSAGKTSTKEAIATVLERTGKPVVKTMGNMATDIGVPSTFGKFSGTSFGRSLQLFARIEW